MKYGWFTELPIEAFKHYGDRRIKPQGGGGPLEVIGDVFEDVGDAVGGVIDGAVEIVGDAADAVVGAVESTVEGALENPIAFAAKAAAIATGQFYLLPYIGAAETLDAGGSVEDALANAAVSYAAGQVGASAAGAAGSNIAGGAAAGATSAALRGGDPVEGALSGAINTGFNQAIGSAANALNRPSMDQGNLNFSLPESQQLESDSTPGLSGNYDVSADYSLGSGPTNPLQGRAPGLASMGGAPGFTAPTGTSIGNPGSFINNPDYYSGMPVGTISGAGFTDQNAMPALGNPGSFINNPNVTGQPVTPTPSCAYNVNLPRVDVASLLGLGQGSGQAQSMMGSAFGTSGASGGMESKIPWLDTRAQMLRNTPVASRQQPQLDELKGLYQQISPELSSVFASKGIGPSGMADLGQLGVMTMADGGLTSSNIYGVDKNAPKLLAPMAPAVLQGSGRSKRQGAGLSPLKHLFGKIHELGNMEGMARGGLPAKYKEAAPEGHNPEFITGLTGFYANGRGTGQSDDIPAMLHDGDYVMDADTVASLGDGSSKAGAQALEQFQHKVPHQMSEGGKAVAAQIADGEYVFPEAFVTALGNGDNKRGAKMLDSMRENLRAHKRSAPTSKIPPKALSPLDYLKKAK